jgi:outer membrane protein insertion porin family
MRRRFGTTTRALIIVFTAVTAGIPAVVSAQSAMWFGDVKIYGNKKTKTYIIRREIPVERGEPYDKNKLALARKRLGQLPGIDYSEIRVVYTPIDSTLRLDVRVTERRTFRGAPIVRRGYENIYSFGVWIADENFRGRSERLGLSALFRGNTVLRGIWENPWLGRGPRIGIGVGADYENYLYVYDDLGGVFKDKWIKRGGGQFSLFYSFRPEFRAFVRLGYEQADGEISGMTVKPDGDRYGTVALGTRYDGRDSRLFPWSGLFLGAEVAGIGPGDEAYSIVAGKLDSRLFITLFGRTVFGLQATATVRDGDTIPIYLREHLGGGLTIRGYDFGTFNGVNSIVTGAEYRIPVNFSRDRTVEDLLFAMSFHLFADAGLAWELGESPDTDGWHGGYGAGFHFLNSWVQGLRVDYGWHSGHEGRLHVEVGAKF